MKIAVSSIGESLESPVDQRFGRARFFIVSDSETGNWTAHSNQKNLETDRGAGISAAQFIIKLGVTSLITGHCGPKAFRALAAGKVKIYQGAVGTVEENLKAFLEGKMTASLNADVEEHFGSV